MKSSPAYYFHEAKQAEHEFERSSIYYWTTEFLPRSGLLHGTLFEHKFCAAATYLS